MVDESIVIEVKDSVESSIAVKIKAIAIEARSAHKDLGTLQKQLNALGVSKLGGISGGTASAATASAKLATAQMNLSTATSRLETAQNQAALSAQRLAAAQSTGAKTVQTAADKFIASLKAQNDAIGKSQSELLSLKAANLGVTQQAAPFIAALKKQEDALKTQGIQFDKNGLSAKQYSAAMRNVPAQITDIIVSLQGGQKPLTVFLQQGGQLKDMFGGVKPALTALATGLSALINPLTVTGTVIGVLTIAFLKGRQELIDFNKENTLTGNVVAVTSSRFAELQNNLSNVGTKGKAAETLTEIAKAGNLAGMNIENISRTSILMEKATGQAVSKTIDQFQKLADSPVKASLELNKTYNYLTLSVYEQIKALDKQGRAVEAANVAEKAYSDAMQQRAQTIITNAGLMEKAWMGVSGAAKGAWDAMLGIGREQTMGEKLTLLESNFKTLSERNQSLGIKPGKATEELANEISTLKESIKLNERVASLKAEDQAKQKAGIAASDRIDALTASTASNQTKLTKSLADYRRDLEDIRKINPNDERLQPKTIAATEAAIKDKLKSPGSQKEENRATAITKIKLQLDNELRSQNLLNSALEKEQMFNQINEGLVGRKIKLSTNETESIKSKIAAIVDNKLVSEEAGKIDEEYNGIRRQFNATMSAANKLIADGTITLEQYNRASLLAQETIANAQNPLHQFNKELDNQFALTKLTNKETEIESYMQGISNDLLAKGIDLRTTDNQTILNAVAALRARKTELQKQSELQSSVNKINEQGLGALLKVRTETEALSIAHKQGMLDAEQYSLRLVKLGVDAANIRLNMGVGTFDDMALSSIGTLLTNYQGMLAGLSTSFGSFFQTLNTGFADSIGRAIVYSEDLGSAIQNVAQNALSQLISSLVQLGIQYVVNAALGESIGAAALAASTTASVTAAGLTATAWAPAAAMVSLASFGANSAPAMAGIVATTAMSENLAIMGSMMGFQSGGYTGNMATDAVAGVVHGQEFVMTAAATRENRPMLEAMNRGAKSVGANSNVGTSSGSGGMNVTIENHGADIETKQIGENDIVIIARRIAKETVARDAPDVMAGAIRNPNSTYSKSLGVSTNTQRRRN